MSHTWKHIRVRDVMKTEFTLIDGTATVHEALKLMKPYRNEIQLISSGGVRNGIDMVKSLILGASMCGIARPFLNPARESSDEVRKVIQRLRQEFKVAMFLLGADSIDSIKNREELILDEYLQGIISFPS